MRYVTFSVLVLSLVLVVGISRASAAYTYDVDLSVGIDVGHNSPGTVTATGTFEIDTLGILGPSNFIDWTIDFNSVGSEPPPLPETYTLTPANSDPPEIDGVVVTADPAQLLLTTIGSAHLEPYRFRLRVKNVPFATNIGLSYFGGEGGPDWLALDHFHNFANGNQGSEVIGDGGRYVIGTAQVPEPNLGLLLGISLVGLVGTGAVRKIKQSKIANT